MVTVSDAAGNASTTRFTVTVKAKPTTPPQPKPVYERTNPYTQPGRHDLNGRQRNTVCEPYPPSERCRTDIWASVMKRTGHVYSIERGWAFNNVTYLPSMTRAQ